jgi:hypothetical protein
MKATKEQMDGELMVIKLFVSNYARDLFIKILSSSSMSDHTGVTKGDLSVDKVDT